MNMIWATRGKNWGFKFLLDGGYEDPLPIYEEIFDQYSQETEFLHKTRGKVALRFGDPLHRKDASGRDISHDFVIMDNELLKTYSFEDVRELVWSHVANTYSLLWDN